MSDGCCGYLLVLLTLVLHSCSAAAPVTVVVGGGAAGYFGAIEAACAGTSQVIILEQAPAPLQKVLLSGGGRCNVLHDETKPVRLVTQGYARGSRQLLGPMTAVFGPRETADWFRSRGVQLKTEADGRMFPATDKSQTIIECLVETARAAGVHVITGAKVTSINAGHKAGGFSLSLSSTKQMRHSAATHQLLGPPTDDGSASSTGRLKHRLAADYVLLATGSSREGHLWAAHLGHEIAPPVPSLFTLNVADDARISGLAGVAMQDAEVVLLPTPPKRDLATAAAVSNAPAKSAKPLPGHVQRGPVLITHSGLSGPAVLKLSAFGARELHDSKYRGTVRVNWVRSAAATQAAALEAFKKVLPAVTSRYGIWCIMN